MSRRPLRLLRGALCAGFMLMSGQVGAAAERTWSVSVVLGGHLPDLSPLSRGLYQAPLLGEADVLVYEGGEGAAGDEEVIDENITETRAFRFDNSVPPVGVGVLAGIELQWHPSRRHSLIIGQGSWEKVSVNQTIANLPLQQYFDANVVVSERRDKISYSEYTLGWRYNVVDKPKFRFFTRLSLHEVFDIDFREDFVFRFIESPVPDLVGVRRVMVVEAQTASLLMGQLGIGLEWFLNDWLSLGVDGGYMLGEREFTLRHVSIKDDFLDVAPNDGDSISRTGLPYLRMSDGSLGYLNPGTTVEDLYDKDTREDYYTPMRLSFDGWRFSFRVSIYY